MQSSYPAHFERDMSCSESEWLALLPRAVGAHEWTQHGDRAQVRIGAGSLHIAWREGEPRTIALVRLPRLHVVFDFDDVDDAARLAFMKRFDLYTQRGGG